MSSLHFHIQDLHEWSILFRFHSSLPCLEIISLVSPEFQHTNSFTFPSPQVTSHTLFEMPTCSSSPHLAFLNSYPLAAQPSLLSAHYTTHPSAPLTFCRLPQITQTPSTSHTKLSYSEHSTYHFRTQNFYDVHTSNDIQLKLLINS